MQALAEEFAEFAPKLARLGGTIRFDLGAAGGVTVNAHGALPEIIADDGEADCTIKITPENLRKLLAGDLDPMMAYALGKIKVTGSMALAMKMAGALG